MDKRRTDNTMDKRRTDNTQGRSYLILDLNTYLRLKVCHGFDKQYTCTRF
jgi:hypothetical protein